MIGRLIFLSAAAYASYWYIRHSNRKAQQLRQADRKVEILPPETAASESAQLTSDVPAVTSRAAEPDPGR